MADVFISYSRVHRHLTEQLARELEARGLEVWWDTELLAGESFRQRIQEELKASKAVIVIWTPESVRSDYVLSEAERARVARKLIQVRTADIEPNDLPPPFDTSHVPPIDDRRSILGGLTRLGVLKDGVPQPLGASAIYRACAAPMRRSRHSLTLAAGLATLVAIATAGAVFRSYVQARSVHAGLSGGELVQRAAVISESFYKAVNAGMLDTGQFAPEVRLGRRGLLTKVEVGGELRKLQTSYARVSCRPDIRTLTVKKAESSPDGFRAIVTSYCDLTDNVGNTTTERFALEIEATRSGSADVIAGLWQPEKMVLWQPR
jgi:hypothetical protein